MTHEQREHSERSRIGDELAAHVGTDIALLDGEKLNGRVTVCRYTPPSAAERVEMVCDLSRRDVLDRLTELRVRHRDEAANLRHLAAALQWAPEYLVEKIEVPNLITQVGDQYYGERASGIAGPPNQVTGMRLGTGSTAPSKTGAGAAIVTYKVGSFKAIDGSFPTSSLVVASRQIQWKTSWGAGVINGSALAEAVITNETPLTDVTGTAANTISRALFGPVTLGALDTLSLTWNHLLLGA